MKDLFGIELDVGQCVGFTTRGRYNYTLKGKIIGFTPKMVKVSFRSLHSTNLEMTNLNPENLVVSLINHKIGKADW